MADVFFSYSHKDRDRVVLFHEALTRRGFEVFWDQEVPPGRDWDEWIRQHLMESRCVVVFWTQNAVRSRNVRHEVTIAQNLDKLVPVILEPIDPGEFPMGLYTVEAANAANWEGAEDDPVWQSFVLQVEHKTTPNWLAARLAESQYQLKSYAKRRKAAESKLAALETEHEREVEAHAALKLEHEQMIRSMERSRSAQVYAEQARDHAMSELTTALDMASDLEKQVNLFPAVLSAELSKQIELLKSEHKIATDQAMATMERLQDALGRSKTAEAAATARVSDLEAELKKRVHQIEKTRQLAAAWRDDRKSLKAQLANAIEAIAKGVQSAASGDENANHEMNEVQSSPQRPSLSETPDNPGAAAADSDALLTPRPHEPPATAAVVAAEKGVAEDSTTLDVELAEALKHDLYRGEAQAAVQSLARTVEHGLGFQGDLPPIALGEAAAFAQIDRPSRWRSEPSWLSGLIRLAVILSLSLLATMILSRCVSHPGLN